MKMTLTRAHNCKLLAFWDNQTYIRRFMDNNVTLDPYNVTSPGVVITREVIEDLLDLCKEVLKDHSKAEDLLPWADPQDCDCRSPFEYDDYYFNSVKETADALKKALRYKDYNFLYTED